MLNSNFIKKLRFFCLDLFAKHPCSAERSLGNVALRKREDTGIKRGSTRSHTLENSLWKRLWTCRETGYGMKEGRKEGRMDGMNVGVSKFFPWQDLTSGTVPASDCEVC